MWLLCVDARGQSIGSSASLASDFFHGHSVEERKVAFPKYPLRVQFDLFIYGNQVIHPPATYLASCFAESGAGGAKLLREKLTRPGSDLDTRDIALLLETMQVMHTFNVSADLQLFSLLKHRVASMKDPGWRHTAEDMVAQIESGYPGGPAAYSRCGLGEEPTGSR
jgi:hypothetical protein